MPFSANTTFPLSIDTKIKFSLTDIEK